MSARVYFYRANLEKEKSQISTMGYSRSSDFQTMFSSPHFHRHRHEPCLSRENKNNTSILLLQLLGYVFWSMIVIDLHDAFAAHHLRRFLTCTTPAF
ncbi:hypothetical protein TNIN_305291 [Trichonephila inaurata madagascariensis]|uniref:Uncharacterized protein n=1 Tax=Trichonephila inaurata madagascariensis TaxID=2747483 RepID=A0A8X6Y887_9ARAC|nr:hypothetical protein TNIN_305291 [Trichonephila inaurata madagascariensis]